MDELWLFVSVMLISAIKMGIGGVPLAITLNLSFLETIVFTSAGAIVGMIFFTYLSSWILELFAKLFPKSKTPKKIITRKNKLIINVKNRFGLIGVAFLTPLILSIPVGSFLAVRYFGNKPKIMFYMTCSILLWSVSLSTISFLF